MFTSCDGPEIGTAAAWYSMYMAVPPAPENSEGPQFWPWLRACRYCRYRTVAQVKFT